MNECYGRATRIGCSFNLERIGGKDDDDFMDYNNDGRRIWLIVSMVDFYFNDDMAVDILTGFIQEGGALAYKGKKDYA